MSRTNWYLAVWPSWYGEDSSFDVNHCSRWSRGAWRTRYARWARHHDPSVSFGTLEAIQSWATRSSREAKFSFVSWWSFGTHWSWGSVDSRFTLFPPQPFQRNVPCQDGARLSLLALVSFESWESRHTGVTFWSSRAWKPWKPRHAVRARRPSELRNVGEIHESVGHVDQRTRQDLDAPWWSPGPRRSHNAGAIHPSFTLEPRVSFFSFEAI